MRARLLAALRAAGFVVPATAVAAAVWWPVYSDAAFIVMVVVTLVAGAALAIVSLALRWPSWALLPASFALFLAIGVPLAVPTRASWAVLPSLDGLGQLISGLVLGWRQLLTITIPVGDYQALLVPAFALVLGSTVLGVRLGAGERTAGLALAPAAVVFVLGILFGSEEPFWPAVLGLALLALVLGEQLARRARRRRAAIRALAGSGDRRASGAGAARSVLAGTVILALASVLAVGMTALVPPSDEREVLRESVEQPFDPRQGASPLSSFRRYLQPENADAVQFRVTGLEAGERVRLAVLDSYDGVVYAVGDAGDGADSGTFVRIPNRIDRSALGLVERRLQLEIGDYSGVWLPSVGAVASVEFTAGDHAALADGFVLNLTTDTAAVIGGVESGDAYTLTTVSAPSPALESLSSATPGSASVPALGELPAGLSARLDSWVGGVQTPGERLTLMIDSLRATGYISHGIGDDEPPSRSGHGSDRISELVTEPRMIGDAEQYAVAAALMARQLGFPARVVFGFAPEIPAGAASVAVTGDAVTAWIEVHTAEHGWVEIDPVPPVRPIPEEEPEETTPISRPQSLVPPPTDDAPDREDQTIPESSRDDQGAIDPLLAAFLAVVRLVGISLLVLAVLAAPFLLVIAAKWRRRRLRRTAPTAMERIHGGWDEFADTALDHGATATPAATRAEFAAQLGTLPPKVLAAVVDRATFAPEPPEQAEADRVWTAVDELRASLELSATRTQRLRALVSVRSLGAVRELAGSRARGWFGGGGSSRT